MIIIKVSKKLGKEVMPRQLDNLMIELGSEELRQRGIFRTSFDQKFLPIVLINRSYHARHKAGEPFFFDALLCSLNTINQSLPYLNRAGGEGGVTVQIHVPAR